MQIIKVDFDHVYWDVKTYQILTILNSTPFLLRKVVNGANWKPIFPCPLATSIFQTFNQWCWQCIKIDLNEKYFPETLSVTTFLDQNILLQQIDSHLRTKLLYCPYTHHFKLSKLKLFNLKISGVLLWVNFEPRKKCCRVLSTCQKWTRADWLTGDYQSLN